MNDIEREHAQDHEPEREPERQPEREPEATAARPAVRVEAPSGPAVGSLVWGLVTLAVAGLVGVHEVTDLRVDLSLALPVGMVSLGLLLVVGAVVTGLRRQGDRQVP